MNRRTVLCTAATIGVGSLAGCLGTDSSSEDAPDPIDLSGTEYDYQGGMEIGAHGGPNGQIFYKDEQPESPGGPTSLRNTQTSDSDNGTVNTDNIAWFHTLVFGLFPYHFERRNRDWEAEAIYVTRLQQRRVGDSRGQRPADDAGTDRRRDICRRDETAVRGRERRDGRDGSSITLVLRRVGGRLIRRRLQRNSLRVRRYRPRTDRLAPTAWKYGNVT